MTNLVKTESGTVIKETHTLYASTNSDVCYSDTSLPRGVLKSKKKNHKHNCKKFLRRKLRKYKRRQDGTEDDDVIDVSKILESSLVIKSSSDESRSCNGESTIDDFQLLRPKNYLFKMVRKRETTTICNSHLNIKVNETVDIPDTVSNDEKKHTNAFQLLMDSRNKSIGSNSPGKDQSHDYSDTEELLEKKNAKSKRQLVLQKMAESKGYNKNKEMDEYQDKVIKLKMKKRAEKLKAMIMKDAKPNFKKHVSDTNNKEGNSSKQEKTVELETIKEKVTNKQSKTFRIIDIFNTINDPVSESPHRMHIPKEDKEFLNKLSPSVKKTESVLSYFKKVEKEPEPSSVDVENDNVIRVKLPKSKRKNKMKKLSLKKDVINTSDSIEINNENKEITKNDLNKEVPVPPINSEIKNNGERQKRKRSKMNEINNPIDNKASSDVTESRPKRSIKKPVKYTEDICLSSSDEELHIFTPKKKKHMEVTTDNIVIANQDQNEVVTKSLKSNPSDGLRKAKENNTPKKQHKLAPIFATKQVDPAALEAKLKFLQSGVPDKLKKIINQQNSNIKMSSIFTKVVHVQQLDATVEQMQPPMNVFKDDIDDSCSYTNENTTFKQLLNLSLECPYETPYKYKSSQTVLKSIKELHPKFPVYRTYKRLKSKSNGEFKDCNLDLNNSVEIINDVVDITSDSPDRLNWTDKYKAISTNEIIGNFESIRELRKWLVSWTENKLKSKRKDNDGSDSSDFYHSDTDSRDSLNAMNNLLIVSGPTGSGKTSSIYAVAAELSIKVIEVNASSKRTGKIMLQDLQEATQSHKVNRGTSTENSQKSQEKSLTEHLKKSRKRGRRKKAVEKHSEEIKLSSTPLSQENTHMSLILIDDADIVFEQDDGFSSAIVQLVQCSKRPVILITSSLMSPHLQRFLQNGKILKMSPLLPQLLGTWLDILCLADNGISWPGVGAKFLEYFQGDIRKTINFIQFYIASYKNLNLDEQRASQNIDYPKRGLDDENSGMSWAEREDIDWRQIAVHDNVDLDKTMWTEFVSKNLDLTKYRYPINLFNIWWNVPNLLAITPVSNPGSTPDNKSSKKDNEIKVLEAITNVIDTISLSDVIDGVSDGMSDITSQPWYSSVSASMSEHDNTDYYMNKHELCNEISHSIVSGTIISAQDVLNCPKKYNINSPGMSIQRNRDKLISRHTSLTSLVNPGAILDRRSLTLDYWSSCRTICRIERSRNDSNVGTKRHNRFSHYFKSVPCKSDTFDHLCDSLSNKVTDLSIFKF